MLYESNSSRRELYGLWGGENLSCPAGNASGLGVNASWRLLVDVSPRGVDMFRPAVNAGVFLWAYPSLTSTGETGGVGEATVERGVLPICALRDSGSEPTTGCAS